MQLYERLYAYIHEYQDLVYRYYSKHAIAFLVDFYNIDVENTVWDDEKMFGGSYERTGELTGQKFIKYKLMPVYFIEEVSTEFTGEETGLIKEGETSFVFPSSYGIVPQHGAFVKFEQSYLMQNTKNNYPVYIVSGIEKSVNTEITFWKVKIEPYQSKTTDYIEDQLTNTYVYFDYDKKFHTVDESSFLTKMMYKQNLLSNELQNYFDDNSGFYLL